MSIPISPCVDPKPNGMVIRESQIIRRTPVYEGQSSSRKRVPSVCGNRIERVLQLRSGERRPHAKPRAFDTDSIFSIRARRVPVAIVIFVVRVRQVAPLRCDISVLDSNTVEPRLATEPLHRAGISPGQRPFMTTFYRRPHPRSQSADNVVAGYQRPPNDRAEMPPSV